MRGTYLRLRPAALTHNLNVVKKKAPGTAVCAMVKANGYGHGLLLAARALASADRLGVAVFAEAQQLRKAGFTQPITITEGFFDVVEAQQAAIEGITCVVHSLWQVELLEKTPLEAPLEVWLKHDSGMHRLGQPAATLKMMWHRLEALGWVRITHVMTHLACADVRADTSGAAQIERCLTLAGELRLPASIANSASIWRYPQARKATLRPGIVLYGASPFADLPAADMGLAVTQTLSARLISINIIEAGESVGYGARWQAPRRSRIGVVAIGYGDGYPRHAPDGTPVAVKTAAGVVKSTLVGRVSMDMLTIDLTDVAAASIGDEVELWGDNVSVDAVAEGCGTIGYELFCQLTDRPLRLVE